jgi:putative aminopeptidase FrvX
MNTNVELLQAFAEAPGAPGAESAVRHLFRDTIGHLGEIRYDALGSVSCVRGTQTENAPRVLVTAHMDEVGFAVQSITPSGFLKIVALGGWWTHNLLAQRVRILTQGGDEVLGVIASRPPHFLTEAQRDKVVSIDQLFVDIGASSREEVETEFGISLGDAIVPDSAFTLFGKGNYAVCKAFDNRVGCAAMTQALLNLGNTALPCELVVAGTVQEEVGCRGAVTMAAQVMPDIAIILEGTPADDTPGFDLTEAQGVVGKGPQIRLLDPTALMHRKLVQFVRDTAETAEIPHQVAVRRSGGTDAKSIHVSGEGVPCVVIGVPARYIHSHNSIVDLADYQALVDLVIALVKNLDAATVNRLRSWE